jgi:hypothetical protein
VADILRAADQLRAAAEVDAGRIRAEAQAAHRNADGRLSFQVKPKRARR